MIPCSNINHVNKAVLIMGMHVSKCRCKLQKNSCNHQWEGGSYVTQGWYLHSPHTKGQTKNVQLILSRPQSQNKWLPAGFKGATHIP